MRNDTGHGKAKKRATSWQIIDIPECVVVITDAPADADLSEIRLAIGEPEFLQLAMTSEIALVMIASLQLAYEFSQRRTDQSR